MVKKKDFKIIDKYVKVLSCILILFLIVWFSSKSLVYSIANQVPDLYVITGKGIKTANVLKKSTDVETFNYSCPVEYVEKEEVQCINVKKGQNIELQTENLNFITPMKIKKDEIYFKVFNGFSKKTMQDVKVENIKTEKVTNISFKAPNEIGDYIYQILIRYDKKNIDYVFRIRVGE